jgi:GT2 family glycosyltransferase
MNFSVLSAIVVHYKNGPEFDACMKSLLAEPLISCIYVIDNSHEHSPRDFNIYTGPRVRVKLPPKNLGYAAGNNIGIQCAIEGGSSHVLVINPDALLEVGVVSRLLAEMKFNNSDLISPRIQDGDIFEPPSWNLVLGMGSTKGFVLKQKLNKPIFFGACFLVTCESLKAVGPLNDNLFLYGEELDYSIRLNSSGFKWSISENSSIVHHQGLSTSSEVERASGEKSLITYYHSARSSIVNSRSHFLWLTPIWFLTRVLLSIQLLLKSRTLQAKAVFCGAVDGLTARISSPKWQKSE